MHAPSLMENTTYNRALNQTDFEDIPLLTIRLNECFELHLDNDIIPSHFFTIVLQIIATANKSIKQLNLSSASEDSELDAKSCDYLRQILENHPNLVRLSISNIRLGDAGVIILSEGLKSNKRLKVLCLNNINMMTTGGRALASALPHASSLTVLNLNDNQELGNPVCLTIMQAC